jgi:hypothetical protein
LRAANARDVIAALFLLDNMTTFKAPHPMHVPAILCNLINYFRSTILILSTGHTFMPFRPTLEANRLLAFWASNCTRRQCSRLLEIVRDINFGVPAVPHSLRSIFRNQRVEND